MARKHRSSTLAPSALEPAPPAGRPGLVSSSGVTGDVFLLTLSGDVDLPHVAALRATLSAAAARRPERIVVDVAEVTFMDTAALRTLIAIRRRCVAGGIGFTLRRPSYVVERLLTITHLSSVFDVERPLLAAA
jgi:anti-sigma B factor antagonist